jgi:hypothetical protein
MKALEPCRAAQHADDRRSWSLSGVTARFGIDRGVNFQQIGLSTIIAKVSTFRLSAKINGFASVILCDLSTARSLPQSGMRFSEFYTYKAVIFNIVTEI